MNADLRQRDQEAVSYLRARIEAEFPELEVFVESWDHGARIRGHVIDSKSGSRWDFPEGLLVRYSNENLAQIVLSQISIWQGKLKKS